MDYIKSITLDVYNDRNKRVTVFAKQGDSARALKVTLTSNGAKITPSPDASAYFRVQKKTGYADYPVSIQEDGTIMVPLKAEALDQSGRCIADVYLDLGTGGISNALFDLLVEPRPDGERLPVQDSFGVLLDARDKALQAVADAEARKTAAEAAATRAGESAAGAAKSAQAAGQSAQKAAECETAAGEAQDAAGEYATMAKSYAVGETGSRDGEDTDNAKAYAAAAADDALQAEKARRAIEDMTVEATSAPAGSGATVTKTTGQDGVAHLAFRIPKGDTGAQGKAGTDGVSPTVTASKSGKVTTITIKDAAGEKKTTINDGADGPTGPAGPTGPQGATGPTGPQGPAGPNTVSTATGTDISGLLKGTNGKVAKAVAGADYLLPSGKAASAGTADKLGSASVGNAGLPIYLASGAPTACTAASILTTIGGAHKWDLLWANANDRSAFKAQTLSIDKLSDYNFFAVFGVYNAQSSNRLCSSALAIAPSTSEVKAVLDVPDSGSASVIVHVNRTLTFYRSTNKIEVSGGYRRTGDPSIGGSAADNYAVPLYILGSKIDGLSNG